MIRTATFVELATATFAHFMEELANGIPTANDAIEPLRTAQNDDNKVNKRSLTTIGISA